MDGSILLRRQHEIAHIEEEYSRVVLIHGLFEEVLSKTPVGHDVDVRNDGVRPVCPAAGPQIARDGSRVTPGLAFQRRCIEPVHEPHAPALRVILGVVVAYAVRVAVDAGEAVRRVHELVVRGVESVLHGALVVVIDFQDQDPVRAPALLAVLLDVQQRRPLLLGQIAEEREHDAVLLLHRVGIDLGPRRRLLLVADRRDARASTVAVVFPAVVGAHDTAVADPRRVAR